MKISLNKLLSATGKISELIAGEKTVVDTMFSISDSTVRICHSNGHKSYVEDFNVETDDEDLKEKFVVNTEELIKTARGFQTSGIIKVSDVSVTFNKSLGVAVFSIEQFVESKDENGEVVGVRSTGRKVKELKYSTNMTELRVSILNRVNYDEFLETSGGNTFKRSEIVEKLDKTSIERGKLVYMSPSMQNVFVYNTAYATEVPFERKVLTENEVSELKKSLEDSGEYYDETFEKKLDELSRVLTVKGSFTQANAKMISNILNKSNSEEVCIAAGDKAVNFSVSNEEESFAISVETAVDNGLVIKQFMKSREKQYNKLQLIFIRECLTDMVNSVADDKIDKKELRFETRDGDLFMTIRNQGASKPSADTVVYNLTDTGYDFDNEKIVISGKVFLTALKQLKTTYVAVDLTDDRSLRLSEINEDKWSDAYNEVRVKTAEKYEAEGLKFDPETTKSDSELLLNSRIKYLETRQYLMTE